MTQEQIKRTPEKNIDTHQDEQVRTVGAEALKRDAQKETLDQDVDELLNEIDDVLEVNAEEFVKNYIQKGGQ